MIVNEYKKTACSCFFGNVVHNILQTILQEATNV